MKLNILFKNAAVLTMDDQRRIIARGFVGVRGGLIAYVGEPEPDEAADRVIDCAGRILMPGLVNAHAHTAMCVMRGYADDYNLQQWLRDKVFPAESRLNQSAVAAGARLGFAEMLRTGTTSVSDMYFFEPKIAQEALDAGIRASLSNGIIAFDPDKSNFTHDRSVKETIELIERYHGSGNGRIRCDASIHGEYTSTPGARRFMTDIALEFGLNMHIHLSETREEHQACVIRANKTPARLFYEEGVFDAPALAAHCVWVTPEDMELMAEKGVTAVHCPVSNLKLASGIAPVSRLKASGVRIALGTDGCCSNNTHDLFEEIKLTSLLAKGVSADPTALNAYDALFMATRGGALAQGRGAQVGCIRPGMEADMILIDTSSPKMRPVYDIAGSLAYAANGSDVYLTMVQGRILYEDGRFFTIDVEKAIREVESIAVPLVLGNGVKTPLDGNDI